MRSIHFNIVHSRETSFKILARFWYLPLSELWSLRSLLVEECICLDRYVSQSFYLVKSLVIGLVHAEIFRSWNLGKGTVAMEDTNYIL